MRTSAKFARKRRQQDGFALIIVVFLTTLLLISVMAIAPSIRTEKQREKEQEMIWRGKQYVRGIKLYYRKNGRFPTSIDDLTKPKVGSLRFMRKAYKDPMNKEDGSWRFIYVGPAGQLIGSLKPQQNFQLPGVAGAVPAAAVGQQATSPGFGQSSFGQSSFGQSSFGGQSGFGASSFGQSGTQPGAQNGAQSGSGQWGSTTTAQGNGTAAADDGSTVPASSSSSDSPVFGGNIIGVGSKINKRSVIIYDKAKNYRLFEFVWNPSKDLQNALGQAVNAGNPANPTLQPTGQGQGTGFGTPSTPAPNATPNGPGMPAPTPPPDQQQPPQP